MFGIFEMEVIIDRIMSISQKAGFNIHNLSRNRAGHMAIVIANLGATFLTLCSLFFICTSTCNFNLIIYSYTSRDTMALANS